MPVFDYPDWSRVTFSVGEALLEGTITVPAGVTVETERFYVRDYRAILLQVVDYPTSSKVRLETRWWVSATDPNPILTTSQVLTPALALPILSEPVRTAYVSFRWTTNDIAAVDIRVLISKINADLPEVTFYERNISRSWLFLAIPSGDSSVTDVFLPAGGYTVTCTTNARDWRLTFERYINFSVFIVMLDVVRSNAPARSSFPAYLNTGTYRITVQNLSGYSANFRLHWVPS